MKATFLDMKHISDWMNDESLTNGTLSKHNVDYLREVKILLHEISCITSILVFSVNRLKVKQLQTLLASSMKTRKFLIRCMAVLKEKMVSNEYAKVFDREIGDIKKRIEFVWCMIKENYRYTEYYPFFEEVGWDILKDFETIDENGNMLEREKFNAQFNPIIVLFDEYKKKNQHIIDDHMKAVELEIETYKKHREEVIRKEKILL